MVRRNSYILIVVIALFAGIFSASCSRKPKAVLNQKEMENLLLDMHILEGSIRASDMDYGHEEEKAAYYKALFNKYGISKEEFDSCLSWYTKHPKQFERIYANVITRLDLLRQDVEKGKYHPVDSMAMSGSENLWNLPVKYIFTKDSARNKLHFEIENPDLLANDMYELSFLHRVAPSDSSLNQHVVMYVNYLNGYVDSIFSKTNNDSTLRRYTLKFKARKNLKIKSLSGYILGNDSSAGKMDAFIDSIKLIRRYNPYRQDSIRTAIMKLDSTVVDTTSVLPKDTLLSTIEEEVHLIERKEIDLKPGMKQVKMQSD